MRVVFSRIERIIDFKNKDEYILYLITLEKSNISYMIKHEGYTFDGKNNRVYSITIFFRDGDYNSGGF